MLTLATLVVVGAAQAQYQAINSFKVTPRFFNDIPTSTFSFINDYNTDCTLDDNHVTAASGFANRHIWRLSNDGGLTDWTHPGGNTSFEFTMDAKLTSNGPAGAFPRKAECGLFINFPVDGGWDSWIHFIITNDGEVAAFGTPVPFYSFTAAQGANYALGTTVKMGARYWKSGTRYKWQWIYGNLVSDVVNLEGTAQGLPWDFTFDGIRPEYDNAGTPMRPHLGAYGQFVNGSDIGLDNHSTFSTKNVTFDPYPNIQGMVVLGDVPVGYNDEDIKVEVRSGATVVQSATARLYPNGHWAIAPSAAVTPGTYNIWIKGETHLAKLVSGVVVTDTGATGVNVSLINGDVDNDNVISVFDYILLSDSFDKVVGDSGYDARADLDRDNGVSIFDYIIMSDNFDQQGAN